MKKIIQIATSCTDEGIHSVMALTEDGKVYERKTEIKTVTEVKNAGTPIEKNDSRKVYREYWKEVKNEVIDPDFVADETTERNLTEDEVSTPDPVVTALEELKTALEDATVTIEATP